MEPASALMTIRIVGGTAAVCAGIGITTTFVIVSNFLRGKGGEITESAPPSFRQMFFLFSALSVVFNLLLGLTAAALLLGYPISAWQFFAVFMPPVLYIFLLGVLWRRPHVGPSIAAATGIGNVGITIPFLCLLPIWGPIALWLAT
jgi:hypothetical protein